MAQPSGTSSAADDERAGAQIARQRALQARKWNERTRLTAAAFDRVSTVVFGGAVLAPIFQQQHFEWWKLAMWVLVGLVLHLAARYAIGFLREEQF